MAVGSVEELRGVLFKAYDGFGDKRLTDLGRDAPFILDDRGKGDLDAQGHLSCGFARSGPRSRLPIGSASPCAAAFPKAPPSRRGFRPTAPSTTTSAWEWSASLWTAPVLVSRASLRWGQIAVPLDPSPALILPDRHSLHRSCRALPGEPVLGRISP